MRRQITCHILMVRPANFGFNEETAVNNAFQSRDTRGLAAEEIHQLALDEFDSMVSRLEAAGVHVVVGKDSVTPVKPDAIFPNNWITLHQEGFVITYPMFAPTRRRERRRQLIDFVLQHGFHSDRRMNLEYNEKLERFLEGTGSVVFDHMNRLAYACISPRTDVRLLDDLCKELEYEAVAFHTVDGAGQAIYHTNVMMAMGDKYVVICMETIRDAAEREMLLEKFKQTGKEVIEITLEQMNRFAGNMLQLRTREGTPLLVMSDNAFSSLTPDQIKRLEAHNPILHIPINTIETYGGGSVRCMMAEIFLPEAPKV